MKLLPRLPSSEGRRLADQYAGMAWQELKRESRSSHSRAEYGTSGGTRITDPELVRLRDTLMGLVVDSERADGHAYFDRYAGRVIHRALEITPSEASHPGGWAFLGCVLAPHIVRWRFPGQQGEPTPTERFLGANRGIRNAFGRLWWRAELLRDPTAGDPYELLSLLGEDEQVQITERSNLAGDRRIARALGLAIARLPARGKPSRMDVMRDAAKRLRRQAALIEMRALSDDQVSRTVYATVDSAIAAALSETRTAVPGIVPNHQLADRELVLDKHLSPNDTGETGSHQAAIAVSPTWAEQIAILNETQLNPSVDIAVLCRALSTEWTWRLVHYNGRRFGTSTRDEYRLTNVGDFLRRGDLTAGERIRMYRIGSQYEVEFG